MTIGLAITGFAALGTYMLSVTTDPGMAALKLRDGLMLTALGKALFVGPLKWVVIFAPLALVFVLSLGVERMRPATAQIVYWIYAALVGVSLASIFMTEVVDLSDPAHPSRIRLFGLVGQEPGASGTVPTELHGMISLGPQVNRVYFGYGTNKGGVLQIVDREKLLNGPKEPTDENLRYPQITRLDLPPDVGAHTAFPLLGMDVAEFGMSLRLVSFCLIF